jgi:vacuolar-type H+-ATPase subunit I/STV1
MSRRSHAVLGLMLLAVTFTLACSDPPTKEMNQAQGAIDAAKAAGADQYAPDDYQAAVAALQRSHDAVGQRDYRQALNYALDARERAHDAARAGAERMAQVRSETEQSMQMVSGLLQQAKQRLTVAEAAHVPDNTLTEFRQQLERTEADVQQARNDLSHQKYLAARDESRAALDRLRTSLASLNSNIDARSGHRPVRRPAGR